VKFTILDQTVDETVSIGNGGSETYNLTFAKNQAIPGTQVTLEGTGLNYTDDRYSPPESGKARIWVYPEHGKTKTITVNSGTDVTVN